MSNRKKTSGDQMTEGAHRIMHDLRTPLTGIYGLAELLLHSEKTPKKRESLMDIMNATQALLDYCRGRVDKIEKKEDKRALKLKNLIQRVVKLEAATIRSKKISFHLLCDKNLPNHIAVDGSQLSIILANLLDNAVKFTPIGGRIRLHVKNVKTGGIVFVICDNGHGMSKRVCQLIQAFLAGKETSIDGQVRIGFGLGGVKQSINQLQGKIDCVSQWRRGTTWHIWIPV